MNIEKLLLTILFIAVSYYPICAIVGFISFIKRNKAESEEVHCNCTDTEITKSFIEDVEAVEDLLPQAESEEKMKPIDVIRIKQAVNDGQIIFYVKKQWNGTYIYCEDTTTEERVCVGQMKESEEK